MNIRRRRRRRRRRPFKTDIKLLSNNHIITVCILGK
jgi:hypothetical protein